jgi:Sec-independent protein translocase protein TatA
MFKKTATFASAMGLFKKAQSELKLASDQNTAQLKEAQQTVDECTAEQARIDNASKFLDNILNGGDKVETVKA